MEPGSVVMGQENIHMRTIVALLLLGLVSTFSTAQSQASPAQSPATASASTTASPAIPATAMSTASPEFEAATIKPVPEPDPNRMNDREEGRRFTHAQYDAERPDPDRAYAVDRRQVVGGPAWVTADEYDVNAVAGEDIHNGEKLGNNLQAMLQKLLADRFHLTFHREQREMSVYSLTVAKGGPKLKAADPNAPANGASCQRPGMLPTGARRWSILHDGWGLWFWTNLSPIRRA